MRSLLLSSVYFRRLHLPTARTSIEPRGYFWPRPIVKGPIFPNMVQVWTLHIWRRPKIPKAYHGIFDGTGRTVTAGRDGTVKPSSNWPRPVPSTNLQPSSLTVPSRRQTPSRCTSRPVNKTTPVGNYRRVASRYFQLPSRHPNLHRRLYRPVQPTKFVHPRPFLPRYYEFTKFHFSH